jgi:hypothetical protein
MRTTRSDQDLYDDDGTKSKQQAAHRTWAAEPIVATMSGMNWLACSRGGEPKVVVVAADLAQHDERLAQDLALGA